MRLLIFVAGTPTDLLTSVNEKRHLYVKISPVFMSRETFVIFINYFGLFTSSHWNARVLSTY
jgi:hypothetical protein